MTNKHDIAAKHKENEKYSELFVVLKHAFNLLLAFELFEVEQDGRHELQKVYGVLVDNKGDY
jgi:hypothetical protein